MKQIDGIDTIGYIGGLRKRELSDSENSYNITYESELTLAEKHGVYTKKTGALQKFTSDKTSPDTEDGSNTRTCIWVIGFCVTLAVFSNSKIGKENIKQLITDCGRPSSILHGSIIAEDGTKYESKAKVVCSAGYTSSSAEAVCQGNGKWSSVYCYKIDCGKSLPSIEFGYLTLNKDQISTYGAMATVMCSRGYHRDKAKVTCQENGRWEEARCLPVDCGMTLPAIDFGHLVLNKEENTTYGAMATVLCSPGYDREKTKVTCQINGRWEETRCMPIDCGMTLPAIDFGHLVHNKEGITTYGAMATVLCSPGYDREKTKVTCQINGRWEETRCMPIECGKPVIGFGTLEYEKTTFMSEASVKCMRGYVPSHSTVTCQASGVWTSSVCQNVDDCNPNPCLNGGVCTDKVDDFVCQCQRWYTGKSCNIDNRPCAKNRCLNKAVCIDLPDGKYKCNCAPHWDGQFCERHH